jgi:hypothetical protein
MVILEAILNGLLMSIVMENRYGVRKVKIGIGTIKKIKNHMSVVKARFLNL